MANLNDLLSPATSVYRAAGAAVAAPLATLWVGGLSSLAYGLQNGQNEATLVGSGLWLASALWSRFTLVSLNRGFNASVARHYADNPLAEVKAALQDQQECRNYRVLNLQREWLGALVGNAFPSCALAS